MPGGRHGAEHAELQHGDTGEDHDTGPGTKSTGPLEFFDGMPTEATAALVLDHLTFLRGVEVFLNAVPAASLEAMRAGLTEFGATGPNKDGDLRRTDGFQLVVPHGQHRHRLRPVRPRPRS